MYLEVHRLKPREGGKVANATNLTSGLENGLLVVESWIRDMIENIGHILHT